MSTFGGITIRVSALLGPVPKLQVSSTFEHCTGKFRSELNQWLLNTFGTEELSLRMPDGSLMVSPATMAGLRRLTNSISRDNGYMMRGDCLV